MKKIIVLFALLLGSIISIAQPVTQRGTTSVTVQDARLFAQYNFRPPVFPDTTSANTQIGLDSCGALIYSRDINAYYYRACSPKRWVRVSSANDSAYLSYRPLTDSTFLLCRVGGTKCDTIKINGKGVSTAWIIGGNANPSPPNLGTTTTTDLNLITNNVARLKVAGNGINRSSAARNKYLTMDTSTRYLYYGDGNSVVYTENPIMSRTSNDSNIIYFNPDTAAVWRGGGGNYWNTSGNTTLTNTVSIGSDNDINFVGIDEDIPNFNVTANNINLTASGFLKFFNLSNVSDTTNYKPIVQDNSGNIYRSDIWGSGGGGSTPSLQDVATVGNYYVNDNGDTLRLNSIDGNNKHPILWTNDQTGAQPNNILDFSYNSGFSDNVAKIKFGEQSGLGTGYIEITDKESIFKNELSQRTIIQNGYNSSANNQTTYFPLMKGSIDTLATTEDIRNSTIDTANKWVNNIYRTSGKDSIIFFIGSTRYAIKDSVGTNPAPVGYYGAFQDNTSQTAASINTAYPVKFNTTDLTNGVSVVNDGSSNPTRITLANTGIYNIQFSLQLEKTGGSGNMTVDIWIRKNGVDIPSTTGKVVLTGSANASPVVAAWNYVLDLVAGDYIQLMWSTSNTNVEIIAAGATSPHPAIPSSILTVTQQSGIMAGTGITAINSLTGAAQTMVTGTDSTDFKIVSTGTTHKFNLPTASATNRGALSSANWSTFNSKLGASDTVSLSNRINLKVNIADTSSMLTPYLRKIDTTNRFVNNISRTVGKDSIIFNIGSTRYAIKDSVGSGGTSYTFSTGLTNSSGTVTNNLSTGVSGGQSVVGGTAASNSLTLSSTSNATKGKILFGTSAYDEVNNRLGIGTTSPSYPFHLTGSTTASSAIARGAYFNNTLVAAANSDDLVAFELTPTFTNGAFTNVNNSAFKIKTTAINNNSSTGIFTIQGVDQYGQSGVFQSPVSSYTGNIWTVYKAFGPSGEAMGFGANFVSDLVKYTGIINALGSYIFAAFNSTKNVSIGSTTDAGYKLDVIGNIRSTGILSGYVSKTTAYTATSTDEIIVGDATSAAFSITLPTAVGRTGQKYTIKKSDASVNAVTVATTSSQTIDGSTTYSLSLRYKYVTVVSDNANWIIIANN